MKVEKNLLYTEEHEWIFVEEDVATIGITDYAQGELGDIVFVELPNVNDEVKQMEPFGTIEAVKAVADLFCPISGEVTEINEELENDPEIVNKDPYGDGWMVKISISDKGELDDLMDAADYEKHIG